jgi:hypothetical protein
MDDWLVVSLVTFCLRRFGTQGLDLNHTDNIPFSPGPNGYYPYKSGYYLFLYEDQTDQLEYALKTLRSPEKLEGSICFMH